MRSVIEVECIGSLGGEFMKSFIIPNRKQKRFLTESEKTYDLDTEEGSIE